MVLIKETPTMRTWLENLFGPLFVLGFALIAGLAVAVTLYADGLCLKSLFMLATWLVATVVLWSTPFLMQRIRRDKRKVHMDERGLMIFKNAALGALTLCWLYFLCACLVAWWLVGSDGSVSVNVLPLLFVGGVVLFQLALVVGSLIQERLGGCHGEE